MKKFSVFALITALAVFVSCQKQQTEEERKAEVERQVQDRLAAERVEAEKQRLAQDQATLEAREKAIADREAAAAAAATPAEEPVATEPERVVTERSETRTERRSTASYGMFYEKLEPYGEWRETADYGYVWQPREAEESHDWRPYTEGRWVYSDAGWTWVSDESFGWATYHYGRWLRLRRVGWVWVPGDEWAPAWVSWRTSKDYVGWAPLPPEARFDRRSGIHAWADSYYDIGPDQYAFVASNEFGSPKIRRAVVPAERNTTIVIETTNVTNITYANTTIVNEGPSYDELRSRGERPIERYRLRRQNTEMMATVRGDELEISAPVITEVRDLPRPRRVKERVIELNIDTGWTAIADRSAAERARTKMKAEATPPPNAPPKKFVKPVEASTTTASATPAPTAATTTAPAPTTTAPAAASATPAVTPRATPLAKAAATATPAATPKATATATPKPVTSPTPRSTAAATPKPVTSPTPRPAATTLPSPTPAASPSPRIHPLPTIRSNPSATAAPQTAASASVSPMTTPAASVAPVLRTPRVPPSIPMRPTPFPTPMAKSSQPPAITETTPPARRIVPPAVVNTPAPTAPPTTPAKSVTKPVPTLAPVRRPPTTPRVLPTP
ncbi:MAG: hypothetical protein QOG51_198, partial [Verrucomicrobiota bacterium]